MMGTTAIEPPVVAPVPDSEPRPLWSVMIPTFNCAHQARDTLASVLGQAPAADAMEIVVVDDASSDDIESVVASYGGRARLHRQPVNLGVPDNLTEAIRLSRGRLVHILHGDDQVRPGFYRAMEAAFADPAIGAAFCRQIFIDGAGKQTGMSMLEQEQPGRLPDALRLLASEQRIMTPSIVVRREAYEKLGGFHPALKCAEDWEMWVRVARHYPIAYVPEPLALYRMQHVSNTGRNIRNARDVLFNGIAIDLISRHLPDAIVGKVTQAARVTYAKSALISAASFAKAGDMSAARAQFLGALKLSHSPRLLPNALRAVSKMLTSRAGR